MKRLQKMGGIAALIGAATNLLALGVFVTVLLPKGFGSEDPDPGRMVALLADNQVIISVVVASVELMAVYGLGLIIWFAWLGIVMVRRSAVSAATEPILRTDLGGVA